MEPGYHTGDLVLVRKAQTYQVGDVVTYRDAEMGSYVIHRIIGIEQGLFVLKGDNNSWIDPFIPPRMKSSANSGSHAQNWAGQCNGCANPSTVSYCRFTWRCSYDQYDIQTIKSQKGKSSQSINLGRILEGTLYLLGLIFLGIYWLIHFCLTRPLTRTADNIKYQQEGYFFYSATGSPGVYDTDTVRSGSRSFPNYPASLILALPTTYWETNCRISLALTNYTPAYWMNRAAGSVPSR